MQLPLQLFEKLKQIAQIWNARVGSFCTGGGRFAELFREKFN
jgi:hypothetical protein